MDRFFIVKVKCGHVGRGYYVEKLIPIIAQNGKEAAYKARWTPRVKHDWKDAISEVREVFEEEYLEQIEINSHDSYFQVKNRQEQNLLCPELMKDVCKRQNQNEYIKDRKTKVDFKMKKAKEMCSMYKRLLSMEDLDLQEVC